MGGRFVEGRSVEGRSVEGRSVEGRLVGRTFCSGGRFVEGRFVLVPKKSSMSLQLIISSSGKAYEYIWTFAGIQQLEETALLPKLELSALC